MSPAPGFRVPIATRLERRRAVNAATGCWEWQGCLDSQGYGRITIEGRCDYVHRASWREHAGMEIPDGRVIDHVCENRACFNPAHLELVSTQENTNRRQNSQASRTHCPKGHRYAGHNLRIAYDKKGMPHRTCVACNKIRAREWRAARVRVD